MKRFILSVSLLLPFAVYAQEADRNAPTFPSAQESALANQVKQLQIRLEGTQSQLEGIQKCARLGKMFSEDVNAVRDEFSCTAIPSSSLWVTEMVGAPEAPENDHHHRR